MNPCCCSCDGRDLSFSNGASAANEYVYDNNGNLTKDSNKGITNIAYNCLNLPSRVTFGDGSTIVYTYAADGTKLRTVHTISGTSTQKDYCANVVYENGVQKLLLTEEGYVNLSDGKYYYYLKDHQGNNRVVVKEDGTVQETNHYYPFGGVFASTGNVQPYKYNGKEHDTKKGLNWYDYGARHYDAALGRWLVVDPLAEKYYSTSAYGYCLNNPVLLVDPNGKEGIRYTDENGNKIVESNIVVLQQAPKSIPTNATAKQRAKIQKKNQRIAKRNAAQLAEMKTNLDAIYNGSDGKGSKNSYGEYVYFKFNLIGVETNDLTGGDDANLKKMAYEYALEGRQYGGKKPVRAPIVAEGNTYGAFGVYSGNRISIRYDAPTKTFSHEVGHSLDLRDSKNMSSLMSTSSSEILLPDEVDIIWEKATEKY